MKVLWPALADRARSDARIALTLSLRELQDGGLTSFGSAFKVLPLVVVICGACVPTPSDDCDAVAAFGLSVVLRIDLLQVALKVYYTFDATSKHVLPRLCGFVALSCTSVICTD